MANVAFTASPFAATDAPTGRTMPARYNDVINVKDFGALGNGSTDDTDAINAAIDYVYATPLGHTFSPGVTIFFPPGTYIISKGGTVNLGWERNAALYPGIASGHLCHIKYVGAGRDVTIIKGNYGTGNQMSHSSPGCLTYCGIYNPSVLSFRDMTIWNDSTAVASCALQVMASGNELQYVNMHFHGYCGMGGQPAGFGSLWKDCKATCSVAITTADNSARRPRFKTGDAYTTFDMFPFNVNDQQFGTVGMYIGQGYAVNCDIEGFEIGIAQSGGSSIVGCRIKKCGIGLTQMLHGTSNLADVGVGAGHWFFASGSIITSNWFERCTWGIFPFSTGRMPITANRISGTTGPTTPATISGISHSGATATVTANAHNLPTGTTKLVLVTNPVGWTPDLSGNQIVDCLKTGTNTFTYSLAANPGSFSSATWNYPIEFGIKCGDVSNISFAANIIDANTSIAALDLYFASISNNQANNTMWCTRATGAFLPAPSNNLFNGSWNFNQCVFGSGTNPLAFAQFNDITGPAAGSPGPFEGSQFTVIDCSTQATFGGTVTSGGSNHYKIRYDGTNWTRMG